MAKNTASKRREVETQNEQETAQALTLIERQRASNFVRALAAGAIMSALVLWSARWGAQQLWAPFSDGGRQTIGSLLVSALFGGAAAAWAGRGVKAPLPAGACALGWALSATGQHLTSQGKLLEIVGTQSFGEPLMRKLVGEALSQNVIYHPLYAGFGLVVASFAGWAFNKVSGRSKSETGVVATSAKAPAKVMTFTILLTILGGVLLVILSYLPARVLAHKTVLVNMPVGLPSAVLCATVSLFAFGLVGYNLEKWFNRSSGVAAFVAAPLVVLGAGALLQRTMLPLIAPVSSLFINSSPFEVACWGAFGAVAGFWVQLLNRDEPVDL